MGKIVTVSEIFPVTAKLLFDGWLDSDIHSEFTDSDAEIDPVEGGVFSAWDGYITGKNIQLIPNKKIVQSWRTTEFSEDEPDSTIEITLESIDDDRTTFTLVHSNIPKGDEEKYRQGWIDFYIIPMKSYFLEL